MIVILKAHTRNIVYIKGSSLSGNHSHGGRPGIKGGSTSVNSSYNAKEMALRQHKMQVMADIKTGIISKSEGDRKLTSISDEQSDNLYEWENHLKSKISTSSPSELNIMLNEVSSPTGITTGNQEYIKNIIKDELKKKGEIGSQILNNHNNVLTLEQSKGYQTIDEVNSAMNGYGRLTEADAVSLLNQSAHDLQSQRDAVDFYQYKGDTIVNEYLRKDTTSVARRNLELIGLPYGGDKEAITQAVQSKVDLIDSAIIDELPQDTVLTRYVGKGHPVWEAIQIKKDVLGTTFTESGYSSTSAYDNFAFGEKNNIRIKIKAPKGTRGLAFSHNYSLKYADEYEFLLPRGSSFKIVATDGKTVVVELLD